jgi:hypothetical protein
MASFDELALKYAAIIRDALGRDGFVKSARASRQQVQTSHLLRALKQVHNEVEGLVYIATNEPLSETDKQIILRGTGEKLGIVRATALSESTKAASNDALDELINQIDDLLQGKGK